MVVHSIGKVRLLVDEEQTQQPKNPLIRLWNILGIFGGIISLSSMVQNWFDDLLKWRGFILEVVESYRAIVTPVFEFLFGWMFDVPTWLVDYIVIGVLIFFSAVRGLGVSPPPSLELELRMEGHSSSDLSEFRTDYTYFRHPAVAFVELVLRRFLLALFQSPIWPIYVIISVVWLFRFGNENKVRSSELLRGAQWFGATVLGFVVLLAINSQL